MHMNVYVLVKSRELYIQMRRNPGSIVARGRASARTGKRDVARKTRTGMPPRVRAG